VLKIGISLIGLEIEFEFHIEFSYFITSGISQKN